MVTVKPGEAQDHILDTLTLGFCNDPVLRWLYPQASSYLEYFPKTVKLFGGAAFDNKTALTAGNGAAAALWLPPGTHPDGDGLIRLFESALSQDVLEDAYKVFEIMDKFHPNESCWHLAFVATDPSSRGKGYGSALVNYILPRCDAEKKLAYLENTNPANTVFYERHGFEVLGEMQAGKSPPMYAMQRQPR